MPFLTDLDSRAAIKGSRDPLGVQSIWTRLGRHVVGNLTTVSTSVRDFTVTMLGYYYADQVAEETGTSDDLRVFLRWEQLAAYARGGQNSDWSFRGTERARKNWDEGARIRLAADAASLIMSDQKTYGLWGLYTVPARSSGLVEGNPTRLTAEALRFVRDNYLPVLEWKAPARSQGLVTLLQKSRAELKPRDRDLQLLETVAKVLRKKLSGAERVFYARHLVDGGPTDSTAGRQRLLAGVLRKELGSDELPFSPGLVGHLAKQCRSQQGELGAAVAMYLERIRRAEQLLAPSVRLFAFLQSSDGQVLKQIVEDVRKHWGPGLRSVDRKALEAIEPELMGASGEIETGRRWLAIAEALAGGDYAAAIEGLLAQNREVMARRGGAAPWVEVSDGKLLVKVAADAGALPTKKELSDLWIHSYFLDSLRSVTREVGT